MITKRALNGEMLNQNKKPHKLPKTTYAVGAAIVLCMALCLAPGDVSIAQNERGRILSTSEQVYVNMVKNGSFEAFSAGTGVAPDGFIAAGINTGTGNVARDNTSKFQNYSVKLTQANATDTYILKYDTLITGFGASLTGDSADLTTTEWQLLKLSDNGYVASVWVKLPGGASNPAAVTLKTDENEKIYIEIDSNSVNDYCYVDGLQVTEGPETLAFMNNPISDTGDQQIFGDLRVQDNASNNYILLDKDTGSITMSGMLTASLVDADTLDNLDSSQFLRA